MMIQQVFAAALNGDQSAVERVLEDVRPVAVKAALRAESRFGASRFDSEDSAQLGLTAAWKLLVSGEFSGDYADFVIRVQKLVANSCSRGHRDSRRLKRDSSREQLLGDEVVHLGSTEADLVAAQEQITLVMEQAGDATDRAILQAIYEGCTLAEAGEVAGISTGAVAGRWKRLKQRVAHLAAV